MTIEIKLQSHPSVFQGDTIEEAIFTIVEWIKKNHSCPSEFSQEIEKVEKFSNDCFAETINKQEIEEKLNDQYQVRRNRIITMRRGRLREQGEC